MLIFIVSFIFLDESSVTTSNSLFVPESSYDEQSNQSFFKHREYDEDSDMGCDGFFDVRSSICSSVVKSNSDVTSFSESIFHCSSTQFGEDLVIEELMICSSNLSMTCSNNVSMICSSNRSVANDYIYEFCDQLGTSREAFAKHRGVFGSDSYDESDTDSMVDELILSFNKLNLADDVSALSEREIDDFTDKLNNLSLTVDSARETHSLENVVAGPLDNSKDPTVDTAFKINEKLNKLFINVNEYLDAHIGQGETEIVSESSLSDLTPYESSSEECDKELLLSFCKPNLADYSRALSASRIDDLTDKLNNLSLTADSAKD